MSRKVETDYEFDKIKFAELLEKAKGSLSLKIFAEKCNLSVSYMCKYIKARLDYAPTPSTLSKISLFTETQGVSYGDLLSAAGYSIDKYREKKNNMNMIRDVDTIKIKTMTMAELGMLIIHDIHKKKNKDVAISLINVTEDSIYDFSSAEKFLVEKYNEECFVDVISIIHSEQKITVIIKESLKNHIGNK